MKPLLIEIGAEEIPAGYIVPALNTFKSNILTALDRARIDHGEAKIYGTPRRLALMVENVADQQNPQITKITGPPENVGFDEAGKPKVPATKFAEKAGVSVEDIVIEETAKGRYLTAVVEEKCLTSATILEKILEQEILAIPFPKSMRWGDLSISFARPIFSLIGLLGETVLKFKVGNVESGTEIHGHQFMNPGKFTVSSADKYLEVTASCGVMPDIEERKAKLVEAIHACAKEQGASILEDDELVNIVTNLVEVPFPVVGKFDEAFLEVPDEVLITAMREHQKYFALIDGQGNLKPLFIAVNNTNAKDPDLVAKGHEKVLRARLSDAKFFYEVDLQSTLDDFTEKLKTVTFQEKLGSVYDKMLRFKELARYLVSVSGYENKDMLTSDVTRAAEICKADLVSQVVIEFTKLQGIIGRTYALEAGEKEDVAYAIEQHYRPIYSGGQLPETPVACLLAIADKLDTICGCFSVDLIPTGGADPYALRRQGIGIIQIMLEENLTCSLTELIDKGLMAYMEDDSKRAETVSNISEFLKNRMINILTDMGYSKEAVNSALCVSFENIPDVLLRVKALDKLRREPDFEPLSVTFKRVENIIRKSETDELPEVDETLFEDASETRLFTEVNELKKDISEQIDQGEYETALSRIAGIRPVVDIFFDDVMVMAEDKKIRKNRIALLSSVSGLFKNFADFSKI